MSEITKETKITQEDNYTADNENSTKPGADNSNKGETNRIQKTEYLIYYIFGALEILLAFRFVLKLAGASHSSGFVEFIYSLSKIFVLPFAGIFHAGSTQGAETTGIFEWSTLVAIVVYALIAWGIVKLIGIFAGEQPSE